MKNCIIALTAILVFYSTLDIELTEFAMIICGFAVAIWVLTRPISTKELYQENGVIIDITVLDESTGIMNRREGVRDPPGTHNGTIDDEQPIYKEMPGGDCSFSSALDALISIPTIVKQNIEPALDHLISTVKEDDTDDTVDSVSIRPRAYVQSKDTYVGATETKIEKDVMGFEKEVESFVLDETLFKKMRNEYKVIDSLLQILKKGDLELYQQIIQ